MLDTMRITAHAARKSKPKDGAQVVVVTRNGNYVGVYYEVLEAVLVSDDVTLPWCDIIVWIGLQEIGPSCLPVPNFIFNNNTAPINISLN